jgi:hypothetical protein
VTELLRESDDIALLHVIPNASSRDLIDEYLGIPSAEIDRAVIAKWRPDIYSRWCSDGDTDGRLFLKVHDANIERNDQWPKPIYAQDIDRVLYIIRDPRDVAVSFARHLRQPVETAIQAMSDPDYTLCEYPWRAGNQVAQYLSTWSAHVSSWIVEPEIPTLLVRYEDLIDAPQVSFDAILDFLGIVVPIERAPAAIAATRFDVLKSKERLAGFNEKPAGPHSFFHIGRSGSWQLIMTDTQERQIRTVHGEVMERFNYL